MPYWININPIKFALLVILITPALAQGGTTGLNDGSSVTVDPTTGKAVRHTDGGSTPLWDGTHRLKDGSVVIIRDGIAISGADTKQTETMPANETTEKVETSPSMAVSPCMKLMVKVCGFNGACSQSPACSPARQLVQLEREDAWRGSPGESFGQCTNALKQEDFFTPCERTISSGKKTPCQHLVKRVCGADDECNTGKGCAPAKQLLNMETEELRLIQDVTRPSDTSNKCKEVYRRRNLFPSCHDDDDDPEDECD
ncbi:MAG: hypothetical protein RPU14_10730 [Candidatus Sedimenticola sp. (ex Thyasira tokunagai)]